MQAYFDNAATTALCDKAKQAMIDSLEIYGNPSSLHLLGVKSSKILDDARNEIASELRADKNEIYFTSGATEADNIALLGVADALKRNGKKIVTTAFEHSAIISSAKQLEKLGFEVVYLKPDESGTVPISAFEAAIDGGTILVSCMSVNNETGAILPVEKLKKIIDKKSPKALLHCDATQSFLKYPIIPKKCGIDLMSISAHKIHGPKGVGALYIKKGARVNSRSFGGEQEKGFRPGTEPLNLIAGFGAAIKSFGNASDNSKKAKEIKDYIIKELQSFDDIVINSPEKSSDYILNLSVLGIRSETMLHFLEQRDIFISSGSACSKGKASHVLSAYSFSPKIIDSALRISMCENNTLDQAKELVKGIIDAKNTLIKTKG